MPEWLKGILGSAAGAVGSLLVPLYFLLIVFAWHWLVEKVFPITLWLSAFGLVFVVLNAAVGLLFPPSRTYCSTSVTVVAAVWGLTLWLFCILVLSEQWGLIGRILGVIFSLASIPVALIASMFSRQWIEAARVAIAVGVVCLTFWFGNWLKAKAEDSDFA
jgi:hypothetical protein